MFSWLKRLFALSNALCTCLALLFTFFRTAIVTDELGQVFQTTQAESLFSRTRLWCALLKYDSAVSIVQESNGLNNATCTVSKWRVMFAQDHNSPNVTVRSSCRHRLAMLRRTKSEVYVERLCLHLRRPSPVDEVVSGCSYHRLLDGFFHT
jgi:hypothetical protein